MPEHQQIRQPENPESAFQKQNITSVREMGTGTTALVQRALTNPGALSPGDVLQLQRTVGNRALGRLLSSRQAVQRKLIQRQETGTEKEEEPIQERTAEIQRESEPGQDEPFQKKSATIQEQMEPEEETLQEKPLQQQETPPIPAQNPGPNRTGLPDNLKTGLEQLSGLDLSDIRVHRNSSRPETVGALAYAQGSDIHLGPGQDRHLPHEGWHVVQQRQGRVKPTVQAMGVAINDDPGLEQEADVMGTKANQPGSGSLQRKEIAVRGPEDMKWGLALPVQGPGVVQEVRKGELTLGILGTIFSLGFAWLSPGFRKYMRDAWYDDEYREKLEANGFRITAGLENYELAFGSDFTDEIMKLAEGERWMDGGAGVGQAIRDYYDKGGKGKTTAIGFAKPESEVVDNLESRDNFEYLSGKFFSEFDDSRELKTDVTKISVITDYNGILSYTRTLSEDLQKYLNNLKVDGKIYTFFYATIKNSSNDNVTEIEWLNQITGAESEKKEKGSFVIKKTDEKAVVPKLVLKEYTETENANIPTRIFRLS